MPKTQQEITLGMIRLFLLLLGTGILMELGNKDATNGWLAAWIINMTLVSIPEVQNWAKRPHLPK